MTTYVACIGDSLACEALSILSTLENVEVVKVNGSENFRARSEWVAIFTAPKNALFPSRHLRIVDPDRDADDRQLPLPEWARACRQAVAVRAHPTQRIRRQFGIAIREIPRHLLRTQLERQKQAAA